MSDQHERERRDRKNREVWTDARLKQLRTLLESLRGKSVSLDVSTPGNPLAPRVFGRLEKIDADSIVVTDLSDANVLPGEKPRLTIGIVRIRDARKA